MTEKSVIKIRIRTHLPSVVNTITVSRTVVTKLRNPNTVSVISSPGSEISLSIVVLVEDVVGEEVVLVVVVVVVVAAVLDGLFPAVLVRRDGVVDEVKINSSPSLGGSSSDSPLPFPLKRSSSAKSRIRLN